MTGITGPGDGRNVNGPKGSTPPQKQVNLHQPNINIGELFKKSETQVPFTNLSKGERVFNDDGTSYVKYKDTQNNREMIETFDKEGKLKQYKCYDSEGHGKTVEYDYDPKGRVRRFIVTDGDMSTGNAYEISERYDNGNVKTVRQTHSAWYSGVNFHQFNPEAVYTYSKSGKLESVVQNYEDPMKDADGNLDYSDVPQSKTILSRDKNGVEHRVTVSNASDIGEGHYAKAPMYAVFDNDTFIGLSKSLDYKQSGLIKVVLHRDENDPHYSVYCNYNGKKINISEIDSRFYTLLPKNVDFNGEICRPDSAHLIH